jgi:hypothetical protein
MDADDDELPAHLRSEASVYTKLSGPLSPWQTRLIKLLPDPNRAAGLRCEMFVADITFIDGLGISSLATYQTYDALSYSWGHPELSGSIECNSWQVGIPPAMETALRHVRSRSNDKWLWCDALCIDQSNNLEKSRQVQTMMVIFAKASRVVAWLGQEAKESHGDLFRALAKSPRVSGDRLSDLDKLATAPWFERAWVRQEVFAAHRIELRVGQFLCPLDQFLDACADSLPDTSIFKKRMVSMRRICMRFNVSQFGIRKKELQAADLGELWNSFADSFLPVMRQNLDLQASDPKV